MITGILKQGFFQEKGNLKKKSILLCSLVCVYGSLVCVYVYVYYMDYYHGYSILGFPGHTEHLMCAF